MSIIGSMEVEDMRTNPNYQVPMDQEVSLVIYHEEIRGRNHELIALTDPEREAKVKALRDKRWTFVGQSQIEMDFLEPPFKPKAFVTLYKGKMGELQLWLYGDATPENPGHPRTWVLGQGAGPSAVLEKNLAFAKEYLSKDKGFSEVIEMPWSKFKELR